MLFSDDRLVKIWKTNKKWPFLKRVSCQWDSNFQPAKQFNHLQPNLYYIFYLFNVTESLTDSKTNIKISKNSSAGTDLRWPSFRQIYRETVLLLELNSLTYAFCSTGHYSSSGRHFCYTSHENKIKRILTKGRINQLCVCQM